MSDTIRQIQARPGVYVGAATQYASVGNVILGLVEHSILRNHLNGNIKIVVTLSDSVIEVEDNGRTFPTVLDAEVGLSIAELMLTTTRFNVPKDEIYCVQAAVALSSELNLVVENNGYRYKQDYNNGHPVAPFEYVTRLDTSNVGMKIRFKLSAEYFEGGWVVRALYKYLCDEITTLIGPFKDVIVEVRFSTSCVMKTG